MTAYFDFYGLPVEVSSPDAGVLGEVRRDFAFFLNPGPAGPDPVRVAVHVEPPRYAALPAVPAAVFTPRNVSYHLGGTSYIDYFGQGLAVHRRRDRSCAIWAADPGLAREIAYLFLLSASGEHLDRRCLHRLHALGVSHHGRGVLLALPSGGGKSTMALELLRRPGFRLISEDTPLVDRAGMVLPFHLPLGVRAEQRPDVPAEYLRTVRRMEFDPKTLIDLGYFEGRLETAPVRPAFLLVGERNLGEVSRIVPLPRPQALHALVKYMVVGLGVYQGLEFLLERGLWEAAGKGGVALSRLRNAAALLRRARPYRFVLGRDRARNTETLLAFLGGAGSAGRGVTG